MEETCVSSKAKINWSKLMRQASLGEIKAGLSALKCYTKGTGHVTRVGSRIGAKGQAMIRASHGKALRSLLGCIGI